MADGLKAARTVHQVVREFHTIPVESGDLSIFLCGVVELSDLWSCKIQIINNKEVSHSGLYHDR